MISLALQRLVTAFLLPPGLFVFLLLMAALLLRRRCRSLATGLTLLAVFLWAVSTVPLAQRVITSLEAGVRADLPPVAAVDAIVLLGGGIRDGVPDLTGTGAPGESMMARIVTAVRIQNRLQRPIIVSGGTPPEYVTPEAVVVRRFLLDLGVPAEQIISEDRSRDTLENARNVAVICREHGYRNLLLVTSAYHVRRARLAFASAGLDVTAIGAGFYSGPARSYGWASYLPSAGALATMATVGREYIGLAYYRWVLGIGEK